MQILTSYYKNNWSFTFLWIRIFFIKYKISMLVLKVKTNRTRYYISNMLQDIYIQFEVYFKVKEYM